MNFRFRSGSSLANRRLARRTFRPCLSTIGRVRTAASLAFFLVCLSAWMASSAFAGGADTMFPLPSPNCLTPMYPCNTVTVFYDRLNTTPLRAYSVTLQLDNLELCNDVLTSFSELGYLSDSCGGSCTAFKVIENGGGSYTVDCAILGSDCGSVGAGGLFTVDVGGLSEGVGSIEVVSVLARDCVNGAIPALPGDNGFIDIDSFGPAPITDLGAKQIQKDNDSDGTTEIEFEFVLPPDVASIEVYRAPYLDGAFANAHPEYDDHVGAGNPPIPNYPPPSPWVLTSVTAPEDFDDPGERGYWFYVGYAFDACGNPSPVSGLSRGILSYHLADVTNGLEIGTGDNLVEVEDMSLLGDHYNEVVPFGDPFHYLDVGPTLDGSSEERPLTDDLINFEDLLIFATDYHEVSAAPEDQVPEWTDWRPNEPVGIECVSLDVLSSSEERFALVLRNNLGRTQGVHARLNLGDAQFLSAEVGSFESDPVFFHSSVTKNVLLLDLALLGRNKTVRGDDIVATFRLSKVEARPDLIEVSLRDPKNRELTYKDEADSPVKGETEGETSSVPLEEIPARFEETPVRSDLISVSPNPFQREARLRFQSPSAGRATFRVYDPLGRKVTHRNFEAVVGENTVAWHGRRADGEALPTGLYFLEIEIAGKVLSGKVYHAR